MFSMIFVAGLIQSTQCFPECLRTSSHVLQDPPDIFVSGKSRLLPALAVGPTLHPHNSKLNKGSCQMLILGYGCSELEQRQCPLFRLY